jgi:nucleoside-diphosphate-sugar epimerase
LRPLPSPAGPIQLAARTIAALPFLPPAAQWVEAASHPAIMDTTKAKNELGWTPRHTALEALRDT